MMAVEREGGRTIGLTGNFTLSGPGLPTVSGPASGQLTMNGLGALISRTRMAPDNGTSTSALTTPVSCRPIYLANCRSPASPSRPVPTAGVQPTDHSFWYLARAAGLSAYLMLFLNVVLGLAVHTRVMDAIMARWRSLDLHQFTALLAMGLLALHTLALLGDHYIGFTLPQILMPLLSPYRPAWTAMGVVALYLLGVVVVSSYMRKRISYRTWRAIHYLTFFAYILALFHGIFAGTDSGEAWARMLYLGTGSVVAILTLRRFRSVRERQPARVDGRKAAGAGEMREGATR